MPHTTEYNESLFWSLAKSFGDRPSSLSFLLFTAEINDLLKFKQNFKSVFNLLLCKWKKASTESFLLKAWILNFAWFFCSNETMG